jgi:hypothetical protein
MKFVDLSTRVRAPYCLRAAMARQYLLLALILSASAASAQPSPVVIRGRIVADADDRPLRRAVVRIAIDQSDREMRATLAVARGQRPEREVRAVLTDEEGRFEIELPEPSSQLIVTKAGYASIVVIPDRRVPARGLDIRLSRGAAVWGRVLERSGAPAVGTRVVARRVEDPSDTTTTYEAETDEAGEYRIGSLPAGTYIMAAGSSPQVVPLVTGIVPGREVVQGIVSRPRLIFPGMTPGLQGPTRFVEVRPGEETGDVDFESTPDQMMITPPRAVSGDSLKINEQETGAIVGRVVTPLGQPVGNALVHISGSNLTRMVVADANGQFDGGRFRDGDYQIRTGKLGFLIPDPSTQPDTGIDRRLRIDGDTRVHDIELVLARGGVIAGAIVDGAGEPFQGVLVRAFGLHQEGGRTVAKLATWPRLTDDRGRYRLFGLPRGSYLIVASIDAAEPAAGRSRAPGFAPVFYPGTAHVESAQPVEVELGGDVAGVDLAVVVTSTVRVAGTAINSSGNPVVGRVSLGVSHRSGSVAPEPRVVPVGPEGAFELSDVPPGDYVLQVQAEPGPGTRAEFGAEYVTVGENDPPPMTIKTSVGATLEGRFVAAGGSSLPMRVQMIHAEPIDLDRGPPGGRGPQGLAVHDDGRFYLTGLYGPMRLTYPAQPGLYLKSLTIAGLDVTDRPFDFGYSDDVFADAEIVLSAGATIAGSIADGPGRRDSAFTVVAFSADRTNWFAGSRHLKRASSSSNGSFEVSGLPPGEYFVAAVDSLGPGDWQASNNLEALLQGATRVTVREGQVQTVTPRLRRR